MLIVLNNNRNARMKKTAWMVVIIVLSQGALLLASESAGTGALDIPLGEVLPLWSIIPFIGILLSIALFPLFAPHFWHHHYPKVALFWALSLAIPFVLAYGHLATHEIYHIILIDYIPFIILLWALFTVAGGILVVGTLKGTPKMNALLLFIGTLIASWIGTTGASMLLIRPVIRANAHRKSKAHIIVFFIFLVSNIGGALTPLGDPPLFLGFLHGVPFFWTLNLLPETLFVVSLVLGTFFIVDTLFYRRERRAGHITEVCEESTPIRISGLHNLFFLGGIILGVLLSGILHLGEITFLGVHLAIQNILRDGFLILMGVLSMWTTKRAIRKSNEFSWGPILEVAYLFAGIFITIIPALAMLKAGMRGQMGFIIAAVREPWHYFWMTGTLSSFLDNAPTYLTFLNTAEGNFYSALPEKQAIMQMIAENEIYLKAISTGAVFMGANTYIGNAPNFMVRSIAEERNIRMPSFFGYMGYSLAILVPVFILVTWIFF